MEDLYRPLQGTREVFIDEYWVREKVIASTSEELI